jgi:hypothetical protein
MRCGAAVVTDHERETQMKFSEAMLKGFQAVNGRVCRDCGYRQGAVDAPVSVCAIGAAMFGANGYAAVRDVYELAMQDDFTAAFYAEWGVDIRELNDELGLPAEHLYGMAVAAGL